MPFEIPVFNPSDYPRTGHVSVPWKSVAQKTGFDPQRIAVLDSTGVPMPTQVDSLDPADDAQSVLTFSIERAIAPARTWLQLGEGSPRSRTSGSSSAPRSVIHLENERLEISFNLTSGPERAWYAGSATSVRLDGTEILDAWNDPSSHDPEKRCMQVDRLRLSLPAWEDSPYRDVYLCSRPYTLVDESHGSVRSCFTLASETFEYSYRDPRGHDQATSDWRLYRILSLFKDADYVAEELYLKNLKTATEEHLQGSGSDPGLSFTARFFTYMRLWSAAVSRFDHIPDWFTIGAGLRPLFGYGFATDVHTAPVAIPHPGYPIWDGAPNSFSWELLPCRRARCVHLFMNINPDDADSSPEESLLAAEQRKCRRATRMREDLTGRVWHDIVYKPLLAYPEEIRSVR